MSATRFPLRDILPHSDSRSSPHLGGQGEKFSLPPAPRNLNVSWQPCELTRPPRHGRPPAKVAGLRRSRQLSSEMLAPPGDGVRKAPFQADLRPGADLFFFLVDRRTPRGTLFAWQRRSA